MTAYDILLLTDKGQEIARLDDCGPFSYTLTLNNIGYFRLTLPVGFDLAQARRDNRIEIWRQPGGGGFRRAFTGLIRQTRQSVNRRGARTQMVRGTDPNDLLNRRIVFAAAGSAQAAMADQADDMITEIVKDSMGVDAAAARQISSTYFSAAASPGLGPSITKAFAYRNVLDVLREIADASRQAGTELYFGVVQTTDVAFEFRTKTGTWGRDRTTGQAYGTAWGNVSEVQLDEDASDEVNFAYGLGRGEEADRNVQTSEDTTRSGASVFGRREAAAHATQETTDAGVLDVADSRVQKGKPVLNFVAKLLDVEGSRYGLDWELGDLLPFDEFGRQFSALVRRVTVSVDENGAEDIDATFEARF